jgi:hypothetical protein
MTRESKSHPEFQFRIFQFSFRDMFLYVSNLRIDASAKFSTSLLGIKECEYLDILHLKWKAIDPPIEEQPHKP